MAKKPDGFPPDVMDENLLKRLKQAIEKAGGQAVVAKISGIPASTLNDYLKGTEARFTRMARIARACKVSLDWLATGDNIESISDIPLLRTDILTAPAHISALVSLIAGAAEFHKNMGLKPSLFDIFSWIGPHYIGAMKLPDIPVEIKPIQ